MIRQDTELENCFHRVLILVCTRMEPGEDIFAACCVTNLIAMIQHSESGKVSSPRCTWVQKQLSALQYCDTITIDPHKSGFCPYPAGAICYRDKIMNTFLHINSEVPFLHGKMVLGNVGIEGSKPGAAAAGVMLANKVMTKCFSSWFFILF